MAPLPKRRHSKARQRKNTSHKRVRLAAAERCPQCHSLKPSHRVCPSCGTYNGEEIIQVKSSSKR